jgi:hypothetical protein
MTRRCVAEHRIVADVYWQCVPPHAIDQLSIIAGSLMSGLNAKTAQTAPVASQ